MARRGGRSVDTSGFSQDLIDRAIAIGSLMGEERNLVGMGLVAASALNRSEFPSAFLSRSASLGDVFAAPHTGRERLGAVLSGRGLPNVGPTQYSTTINTPGTRYAYDAFRNGILGAVGYGIPNPAYADRYAKANVALDVATKARDFGIDLGVGITNYGAGRAAATRAGVGGNPAEFGDHYLGPFGPGRSVPAEADFAARFAAAAALTGVDIPADMEKDIHGYVDPGQISAAASIMQVEAQRNFAEKGIEAFPTLSYSDLVQPTGFRAVDVPAAPLGSSPLNAKGWAGAYGITPNEENAFPGMGAVAPTESASLGPLDLGIGLPGAPGGLIGLDPSEYSSITNGIPGLDPLAGFSVSVPDVPDPAGQFAGPTYGDIANSLYGDPGLVNVPGAPDPMSTIDGPTYADVSSGLYGGPPASDISVSMPPGPSGLYGLDVQGPPQPVGGYHAGVDAGPWGQVPDFSAPSVEDRLAAERISDFESRNLADIGQGKSWDDQANDLMSEIIGTGPYADPKETQAIIDGLNASGSLVRAMNPPANAVESYGYETVREPVYNDVPVFSEVDKPYDMQAAYAGDWEDKLGAPHYTQPSVSPQKERVQTGTRREIVGYRERTVPRALPSQPVDASYASAELPGLPSSGLGSIYGTGQAGFDNFLGSAIGGDSQARDRISRDGMGYALGYAMGDGPYSVMGTNDLQSKYGQELGLAAPTGIVEGFRNDYDAMSPMGQGFAKGMVTGGPLGGILGGAIGYGKGALADAFGIGKGNSGTVYGGIDDLMGPGFAGWGPLTIGSTSVPTSIHDMLGLPSGLHDLFSHESYGGGLLGGTPGSMSSYGTPFDDAGLSMPHDAYFSGGYDAVQGFYDGGGAPGSATSRGEGTFGGDPSQDGGSRYGGW